ncbi:META domain-containing protein [Larkinella insperata]|uniref:META domain-containing protein n=1 Tax=Larkinella insperata TaxID=332158 RepID=A0ABW3QLQ1_9BACT|nr:META domain-containing protein [Larkinella insperata]
MRLSTFASLLAVAALFGLGACNKSNDAVTGGPAVAAMRARLQLLEGTWRLANYRKQPLPPKQQNRVTLNLANHSGDSLPARGTSFVNRYGGTLKIDQANGLSVLKDGFFTTERAGPRDDQQAEEQYYRNLSKATYFDFNGSGQLLLYLGDKDHPDTEVLIFAR